MFIRGRKSNMLFEKLVNIKKLISKCNHLATGFFITSFLLINVTKWLGL